MTSTDGDRVCAASPLFDDEARPDCVQRFFDQPNPSAQLMLSWELHD